MCIHRSTKLRRNQSSISWVKKTVDGYFFKMSDSLFATYNIVGHGTELNRRLNMLEASNSLVLLK